jgi:hypothetical protein
MAYSYIDKECAGVRCSVLSPSTPGKVLMASLSMEARISNLTGIGMNKGHVTHLCVETRRKKLRPDLRGIHGVYGLYIYERNVT